HLESLAVSVSRRAVVNQLLGTMVLIVAVIVLRREMRVTIIYLPLILIPQLIATFGAAWLVASLGVFVRDIVQGITLVLMAWMYLTPIIYPESIVPAAYRSAINLNPFTPLVRNYRRVILVGLTPDWSGLVSFAAVD